MTRQGGPHIGYLVQQFPPEVGAGPARVAELGVRWLAAGAALSVFTGMPNRPEGRIHPKYRGKLAVDETWWGIAVHRTWLYASPRHGFAVTLLNNLTFMATAAANAVLRARGVDVLIASSPPFFVHLAGRLAARARRVPLVLEVRDLWPDYLVGMGVVREGPLRRALFALERRLLRGADHVVVVTHSFRRRVIEKGVDPARVSVIPNGVDTSFYHPGAEEPPLPALRRRGDEFLVGYLGNFGASQDLSAVVEAAALLETEDPSVRIVLVGDGTERAKVEERAAALAPSNLSIHPPIPKERTRAFYAACDGCLVPLAAVEVLQETIPSKLFEVMACEVPVVASLAGEAAAIVRESGGGVVCAPADPRAIADAVLALRRRGPAERAEMGRNGREYVRARYGRDALARRYLEVLTAVGARARAEPLSPARGAAAA